MRDVGVYSSRELMRRGVETEQVRKAVRGDSLLRLRRGWYATPRADPAVVAAVRRGGVLGCLSALRMHGVWVPEHPIDLHVRANSQNRRGSGRFCSQHQRPEPEAGAVDNVPIALRHAARCLDDEGFVVVCDSILNRRLLSAEAIADTLTSVPESKFRLLDKCDPNSQSGTETMVRLRLRSRRIGVETQVTIPGVGRVDLLVGERLIVETDSEAYHSGHDRYTEDRRRDREAVRLGYLPLRFTYDDVVHRWTEVEKVVLELVQRRQHRAPRHNRHRSATIRALRTDGS